MKSSPRRAFDVFDFKEEDELPELEAGRKFLEKFKNPNLDDHAVLKYEFLECAAHGEEANIERKEDGRVHCVDVDASGCDRSCDNAESYNPLHPEEENFAQKEELSVLDTGLHSSSVSQEHPDFTLETNKSRNFPSELERKDSCLEAPPPGKGQIDYDLLKSPSCSNDPVDVASDADESMNGNSPSSPTSEIADDGVSLNGYASDHCFGSMEMDDIYMEVVLCPDYVIYRDIYCTAPLLTFSRSCIKISGSTPRENEGTFEFECGVDDLIDIGCQWMRRVDNVTIKLRVIAKDVAQTNNVCSTSGIEELKIAVVDPNWSHKQELITSMNVKYMAVWNVMVDTDLGMDGDELHGQRRYFPNFDQPFEDVVYPKGDPDAVSISKRDVDLLQPETFINDTIIDFYIKYLKNRIQPEDKHRFHFFNSFFFRKLADMDKDPTSASDGRAAFLRVRKWTRKVDIFEKDYIFIPINFNLHWSLIVICHPGEVARLEDEDLEKSPKISCILHMDSIKGSHTGIKNLIQSYLWEEWKERQKETREDISSKFLNLRFVSLELPQQENSFDCGLFLLHYLELFLAEAPDNFSPFKIINPSKFDDAENSDRFVYLPSGDGGFQQIVGMTPQAHGVPYSSKAFRGETSYSLGISVQEEHDNLESSSETSNCSSDDSDVGIIENLPVGEDVGTSQKEETNEGRPPSTDNMECLTESLVSAASMLLDASAVEGFQDPDKMCDGNGDSDQVPTNQENPVPGLLDSDIIDNREVACDNVPMNADDQVAESCGQRAAKRPRLTPPEDACENAPMTGDDQVA
ncbi:hypothetical protein I3842_07G168500 [Carya illinoinensis]|uniref:Ubiquitin-like protease family profile domain-containing protein n=1 Tax=Carya illinoinensis TaxID=32201 RepID=A0A922JEZ5_CARIL|nr:hypothetical protein I3842_07G168500 [Carya illinoinensis]